MPALSTPLPPTAAGANARVERPRPPSGRRPSSSRRSSARREARRAARRQRRLKRGLRAAGAWAAWSLVAGMAVSGMYQWLGSDKVPLQTLAQAGTDAMHSSARGSGGGSGSGSAMGANAGQPSAGGQVSAGRVSGSNGEAGAAAASPQASASAAGGMVMTATGLAPAGSPAALAAAKAAKATNLAFLPGSEVLDGGNGPDAGAGAPAGSWSATIATSEPMAKAVSYYREQLAARRQPTDPPINEMSPGPGQTLLSLASQQDGAHHAVWIGEADGKVLIRLVRTLPEGN